MSIAGPELRELWREARPAYWPAATLPPGRCLIICAAPKERLQRLLAEPGLTGRVVDVVVPATWDSEAVAAMADRAAIAQVPWQGVLDPGRFLSWLPLRAFDSVLFVLNSEWGLDAENLLEIAAALRPAPALAYGTEDRFLDWTRPEALLGANARLAGLRKASDSVGGIGCGPIAFDLRAARQKPMTGVGRTVLELGRALAAGSAAEEILWLGEPPSDWNVPAARAHPVELSLSRWGQADSDLRVVLTAEHCRAVFSPYYPFPRARSCPGVLYVNDLFPLTHPEWAPAQRTIEFFDGPLRDCAKEAELVMVPTAETARTVATIFRIPETRLRIVPHAVSGSFRPSERDRARPPGLPEEPYFLYLGALEPRKNLGVLLEAYELLQERLSGSGPGLVIAGARGWKEQQLRVRLRQSRWAERIHSVGAIEDRVLPDWYAGCTAFVFPSLDEGFGLPVLEAMACGAPVITSDVPVLREVAGDAAIFFNPHSAEELALRLEEQWTSTNRVERVRAGFARAREFTWTRAAEVWWRAMREVG